MLTEQLLAYVKTSLSSGISKDDVTKTLLEQGWSQMDIDQAIAMTLGTPLTPAPQTIDATQIPATGSHMTAIVTAVILILVVISGVAVLAMPSFKSLLFTSSETASTTPVIAEATNSQSVVLALPKTTSEACKLLFPGGITENSYTPPTAISVGATDASVGGKVTAIQLIVSEIETVKTIQITGTLDPNTLQVASAQAKQWAAYFPSSFTNPVTKQTIPPDADEIFGPYAYRMLYIYCGLNQSKQEKIDSVASVQFNIPGEIALRLGETGASVDGKYKITLENYKYDTTSASVPMHEIGFTVVAGTNVAQFTRGWGGQAKLQVKSEDIVIGFVSASGAGSNTTVTLSVSKTVQ